MELNRGELSDDRLDEIGAVLTAGVDDLLNRLLAARDILEPYGERMIATTRQAPAKMAERNARCIDRRSSLLSTLNWETVEIADVNLYLALVYQEFINWLWWRCY